VRQELNR